MYSEYNSTIPRALEANPDPLNTFITPSTNGSTNPVYTNGSILTIKWSNNSTKFDVIVYSDAPSYDPVTTTILSNCTNFTQSINWTVTSLGLPNEQNYIGISDLSFEGSFTSTVFNISFPDTNPSYTLTGSDIAGFVLGGLVGLGVLLWLLLCCCFKMDGRPRLQFGVSGTVGEEDNNQMVPLRCHMHPLPS